MNKHNLFLLLVLFILIAAAISPASAYAASKGCLLKEYTVNEMVRKGSTWKSSMTHKNTISYNKKKDPVKITDKVNKNKTTTKFKYSYKSGKKYKRKYSHTTVTYKKGIPQSLYYNMGDGYERSFNYKFTSRYANYVLFKDIDPSVEEEDQIKNEYIFTVKTKKGLPVKITGQSIPYTCTFYTSGSKKGLIKSAVVDDSIIWGNGEKEWNKNEYKYTYTIKKGKVTKAVRTCKYTYGSDNNLKYTNTKDKFSFKYNKTKADQKRYCAMINDVVANSYAEDPYGKPVLFTYWY